MGRVEKILFAWLVAMLVGVTATGAYVVVEHATRCSRFEFSDAMWHSHRNKTANRLVECHRLEGLDAGELRAQLGRPDERFRDRRSARTITWRYEIGIGDGLLAAFASESLVIELSGQDVVRRARIVSVSVD